MEAARMLHAKIWAARGGTPAARFYQCEHGSYHWTRQINPNQKAAA